MFPLHITRLSSKGLGLSSCKTEVRGALPGEEVLALVGRRRKGRRQGALCELVVPSPHRILPKCPHVPECGGCTLQQLSYTEQLRLKEALVAELFAPYLREGVLSPIIPCKEFWHFRGKMEFTFSQSREGERFLGLILGGSRGKVINLSMCPISFPWVGQLLEAVRDWWQKSGLLAYRPSKDAGTLRTLTVREGKRTGQKMVILGVSGNPAFALSRRQLESFVEAVKKALGEENLSVFLRIQQALKGSETQFFEMHLFGLLHIEERLEVQEGAEKRLLAFKISPTSFFQPNPLQAEILFAKALEMVSLPEKAVVLDLYAGSATLSRVFAKAGRRVIAIELNPHALFDAEEACREAGIELHCGDVGEVLSKLTLPSIDLAIVDPPRAGLSSMALSQLIQHAPQQILYISCNPKTQVENFEILASSGYQLERLLPVDQFPHSMHVETIALITQLAPYLAQEAEREVQDTRFTTNRRSKDLRFVANLAYHLSRDAPKGG